MILGCLDGGLICGPVIVALVTVFLGWLGVRRTNCRHGCEHEHK